MRNIKNINYKFVLVILLIVTPLVIFCAIDLRYKIFSNWVATSSGQLNYEHNEALSEKINKYFENYYENRNYKRRYVCVHYFLGQDYNYAYINLVCGLFKRNSSSKITTIYGRSSPIRIKLNKDDNIIKFSQPENGRNYKASYNWLFPREIQKIDKERYTTGVWGGLVEKAIKRQDLKRINTNEYP